MASASSSTAGSSTTLYFVRHGETEYNRRGIVQGGGIDSVLNDTGRSQAEALARRLAGKPFETVYSSTLRRAKQTADILAAPHEPVARRYLADLEEMAWGVYEGEHPSEERDAALQAIKADWRAGHYDRAVEGGESIREVEGRAHRALERILDRDAGRKVLVVTHGRYLRVLLSSILDEYGLDRMQDLGHSNTCVNRVVHRNGRFRADLLNCTRHLA